MYDGGNDTRIPEMRYPPTVVAIKTTRKTNPSVRWDVAWIVSVLIPEETHGADHHRRVFGRPTTRSVVAKR